MKNKNQGIDNQKTHSMDQTAFQYSIPLMSYHHRKKSDPFSPALPYIKGKRRNSYCDNNKLKINICNAENGKFLTKFQSAARRLIKLGNSNVNKYVNYTIHQLNFLTS